MPLHDDLTENVQEGPSVEGSGDPKSMFMFSYNQSKPECCPSTYSTSTGCVCTTKKQRDFIIKRGNNKTSLENNEI